MLSSGLVNLETGATLETFNGITLTKANLVSTAFSIRFGFVGSAFIAISVMLFAFSTVLGWSHYGTKSWEYLIGTKSTIVYRVIFILCIMLGAQMASSLAWDISDTFNGLMMIPNLIGVLSLTPLVIKLTNNYVDRNIKGKDIKPMLSLFPEVQAEMEKNLGK